MIPKSELKIERIRGKGPGGQNRNKVSSCVRATHIPTGIMVVIDGREQHKNLKKAIQELENRIKDQKEQEKASQKKARRDKVIHDTTTIRTYDFKKGLAIDHRTGKKASLKDVLLKGKIDLLK